MSALVKKSMPTIGIAGVTIPGAIDCINKINQRCEAKFSNQHQRPNIVLHQPNFEPTHHAQVTGRWDIVADRLIESVQNLTQLGADFVIIPANTVHKVIDSVQERSSIPIISILDVVAYECSKRNIKTLGIMGTRWTMADNLYRLPLSKYNIKEFIPTVADQATIQEVLFKELIPTGRASGKTMQVLLEIVGRVKAHCDSIALACTELPLVLNSQNCGLPVLDTTDLLAKAAVERVLLEMALMDSVEETNTL